VTHNTGSGIDIWHALGHPLTPASSSDRFIRAVGPQIEIGTRARQIDGYRVPTRSADAGQAGVSQRERATDRFEVLAALGVVGCSPKGDQVGDWYLL